MIYFFRIGTDGPIKIGWTEGDIKKRLTAIQTGNPCVVNIMGTMKGDADLEKDLHHRFKKDRLRGEWFTPSLRILKFISSNKSVYIEHETKKYNQQKRVDKKIRIVDLATETMISNVHICNIIGGKSRTTLKAATELSKACKSMGATITPEMWIDGDRSELKALLGR